MSDLFRQFEKLETGYMDTVWESIENRANDLLKQQAELYHTPVYTFSATFAREHGEMEQYRTSHRANVDCKNAIEDAIASHYRDNRLDISCVKEVVDRFGMERTAYSR